MTKNQFVIIWFSILVIALYITNILEKGLLNGVTYTSLILIGGIAFISLFYFILSKLKD